MKKKISICELTGKEVTAGQVAKDGNPKHKCRECMHLKWIEVDLK